MGLDHYPSTAHGWQMTTTDEPTVQLSGRRGLLAAIPAMLGFHPQESLVMVCLSGPRRRVGPVIRLDLDDPAEPASADTAVPSAQLRLHASRYADAVALLCYTERPGTPALFEEVLSGLCGSATTVLDAVLVRQGRVFPARTAGGTPWVVGMDDGECDVPGPEDPQAQAMAAASALHGRGVLPSRQALRDSISGPHGSARRQAEAALRSAAQVLVDAVGSTGRADRHRLSALAADTTDRALAETAGSSGVAMSHCALIALLVADVEIRDEMIERAVQETEFPWIPLLVAVAASTPDEAAAEVCAVLSVAAYRHGDGALAQVAVDRCLAAEPGHRLAHLMLGVMAAGLPPADLAHLAARNGINPGRAG
jgi:hypothetical protein